MLELQFQECLETEKQKPYSCDITYATNNELGFDYLRDNMAFSQEPKMQKELAFAIIDDG